MESVDSSTFHKEDDSIHVQDRGITFDVESNAGIAGAGRSNPRRNLVRRLSEHSISEKVPAENILPIAFKTISHRIEDTAASNIDIKFDERTKEFADKVFHIQEADQVANSFFSNVKVGLNSHQQSENFKKYGANVQSKPPSGWFKKILVNFFGGFGLLLMIGGILCCVAWKPLGLPPAVANLVLGVVLFIVFIAQAIFNFVQDFSSSRVMDSIASVMPDDCQVVRDGRITSVAAKDIVPGDLVCLETGTKVPTDVRITEFSPDLAFDRSLLTGESKPIQAASNPDLKGSNYLELHCIAMQGSFCVSGSGRGIVVATGDNTVFGKIAKISSQPRTGLTPLQSEVLRFVLIVVGVIVVLMVLVVILWAAWLRRSHPDWINVPSLIVDLVSVAVAFIPEGLPIALTSCLIITAGAMKKNNILCKSLAVVETLGSVSVLCSDKTGTLTKNKMFVTDACLGVQDLPPTTNTTGATDFNEKEANIKDIDGIEYLYTIAGLCNSASFDPRTIHLPLSERIIHSNATDQAILRFAESIAPTAELEQKWNKVSELSFNSKAKFMARLYETKYNDDKLTASTVGLTDTKDQYFFAIKGAPDILLDRCTHYLEGSITVPLDANIKSKIMATQSKWANQGKRVVLLASKTVIRDKHHDQEFWNDSNESTSYLTSLASSQLTFAGLVGITDPPKDDIVDVIATLRGAGIRLAMVTGDFELTAVAIARLCGIITRQQVDNVSMLLLPILEEGDVGENGELNRSIVITSSDINNLTSEEWDQLTRYTEIVFARATPEQKLRIVEEFQSHGHVVGMTGDGVNDAPSLKQADVGIAMAEGSDIAKEASDLVLLDSFSSMVEALRYGRLVFENLRKTIAYLLPAGTFAELWPVILNIIFGLPQVLSSFCMIIICCLTDCVAAITLAYEAPELNLLLKKPRSITGERLVDMKLFGHSYFTIGTFYSFTSMLVSFLYFRDNGIPFSALTLSYGSTPSIDPEHLSSVSNVASSIYFINLVVMQFFNLMAVRTRYLSIFQHSPVLNKATQNYLSFFAIAFALGVTFFFNYIPWFNTTLGTAHVPAKYYFIAVGWGAVVLLYDEGRKAINRRYPKGPLAKIAW